MKKVGVLWFQAVLTLWIKTKPLHFMSHFSWQFLVCKIIPCCSHDFHRLSLSQGVLAKDDRDDRARGPGGVVEERAGRGDGRLQGGLRPFRLEPQWQDPYKCK